MAKLSPVVARALIGILTSPSRQLCQTCLVFLQKAHHFINVPLAYKVKSKVAGKVAKCEREARVIESTTRLFLRCNIAGQRSLRGGINPGYR